MRRREDQALDDAERTPDRPAREQDRVVEWWRGLQGETGGRSGPDRAALARLRRSRNPLQALMVPATLSLLRRLPKRQSGPAADRVAALAAVLAHVREHVGERRVAQTVGRSSLDDSDSALLSEGRFRRLMQAQTTDELQRGMTRLVHHMKGRANVRDLAEAMLFWSDAVKRRWIFDYYAVGVAAPGEMAPGDAPGTGTHDCDAA